MTRSFSFFRYFHKVPPEPPELEMKATYGLASPQDYILPNLHPLWTGDVYAAFDVSKATPPKVSAWAGRGGAGQGAGHIITTEHVATQHNRSQHNTMQYNTLHVRPLHYNKTVIHITSDHDTLQPNTIIVNHITSKHLIRTLFTLQSNT